MLRLSLSQWIDRYERRSGSHAKPSFYSGDRGLPGHACRGEFPQICQALRHLAPALKIMVEDSVAAAVDFLSIVCPGALAPVAKTAGLQEQVVN